MRFAPVVVSFLLAGCGPWSPGDSGTATGGGADCVDFGFEAAASPSMTVTQMVYNAGALATTFDPNADYQEWGPSGCYNPSSGEFQWVFESGGQPVGALRAQATTEGNQDLASTTGGTLEFRMYKDDLVETTFTNVHFVSGTYTVNSLDPFQVTVNGNANNNGNTLMVNLTARASKP